MELEDMSVLMINHWFHMVNGLRQLHEKVDCICVISDIKQNVQCKYLKFNSFCLSLHRDKKRSYRKQVCIFKISFSRISWYSSVHTSPHVIYHYICEGCVFTGSLLRRNFWIGNCSDCVHWYFCDLWRLIHVEF